MEVLPWQREDWLEAFAMGLDLAVPQDGCETQGSTKAQGPPGLSWPTQVCLVQCMCPWSGSSLSFSICCSSALRRAGDQVSRDGVVPGH